MKYEKLISRLTRRSDNSGYVAVALVAGLAAGAVLSLLFAPQAGADTRKMIGEKAKDLGQGARDKYVSLKDKITGTSLEAEEAIAPEVPHFVKASPKKRKSAIGDIVHEAHIQQSNTEQSIG